MTPWELASGKKVTEHSHQRALFAWANCAATWGFAIADKPEGYNFKERELLLSQGAWVGMPVPELARLFAIHNQGHGDAIRGGRAKAEGVKAGVPDTMLPVPRATCYQPGYCEVAAPNDVANKWRCRDCTKYHGLFVELKLPKFRNHKDGGASDEQHEWIKFLETQGYRCAIAYGWEHARDIIREYLS